MSEIPAILGRKRPRDLNLEWGHEQVTAMFKALSDPTRQRILRLLEEHPRYVGEIVKEFDISQTSISQHLQLLKRAKLVTDEHDRQNVFYSIRGDSLLSLLKLIAREFPKVKEMLKSAQTEEVQTAKLDWEGDQVLKICKALSDGTRQGILRLLEKKSLSVGAIVHKFSSAQPTISRHLYVLRIAELVRDKRKKKKVIYEIQDDSLFQLVQVIRQTFV